MCRFAGCFVRHQRLRWVEGLLVTKLQFCVLFVRHSCVNSGKPPRSIVFFDQFPAALSPLAGGVSVDLPATHATVSHFFCCANTSSTFPAIPRASSFSRTITTRVLSSPLSIQPQLIVRGDVSRPNCFSSFVCRRPFVGTLALLSVHLCTSRVFFAYSLLVIALSVVRPSSLGQYYSGPICGVRWSRH